MAAARRDELGPVVVHFGSRAEGRRFNSARRRLQWAGVKCHDFVWHVSELWAFRFAPAAFNIHAFSGKEAGIISRPSGGLDVGGGGAVTALKSQKTEQTQDRQSREATSKLFFLAETCCVPTRFRKRNETFQKLLGSYISIKCLTLMQDQGGTNDFENCGKMRSVPENLAPTPKPIKAQQDTQKRRSFPDKTHHPHEAKTSNALP